MSWPVVTGFQVRSWGEVSQDHPEDMHMCEPQGVISCALIGATCSFSSRLPQGPRALPRWGVCLPSGKALRLAASQQARKAEVWGLASQASSLPVWLRLPTTALESQRKCQLEHLSKRKQYVVHTDDNYTAGVVKGNEVVEITQQRCLRLAEDCFSFVGKYFTAVIWVKTSFL